MTKEMSMKLPESSQVTEVNPELVVQRWQYTLASRYEQILDNYNNLIDDLVEKLKDLEFSGPMPDLELTEFSFISEFEIGNITAKEVVNRFKKMNNLEDVASRKLTKKLYKFIEKNDGHCVSFFKYTLQEIKDKILPDYARYLKMLSMLFQKMSTIDDQQVKLSWLMVDFENNQVNKNIFDLTLNQTIRQIAFYCRTSTKFSIGENILTFDVSYDENCRQVHYIFGPRYYIKFLKEHFNVIKDSSLSEDREYISNLIRDYIS